MVLKHAKKATKRLKKSTLLHKTGTPSKSVLFKAYREHVLSTQGPDQAPCEHKRWYAGRDLWEGSSKDRVCRLARASTRQDIFMPGPAPEPTRLKLLKGLKPYRINKNEPKPRAVWDDRRQLCMAHVGRHHTGRLPRVYVKQQHCVAYIPL